MKCIRRLWQKPKAAVLLLLHKFFHSYSVCGKMKLKTEDNYMNNHTEEIRNKYIQNPPEGMTADDVRSMSDNDLLDMDYFLHEDDDLDDDIGEEGFYIF